MPIIRKEWLENAPAGQPAVRLAKTFSTFTLEPSASARTLPANLEDAIASAGIPIYSLDEEIPPTELAHPRLTLVASDLTSPAVLRDLLAAGQRLQPFRSAAGSFPKPIYAIGPGARYSPAHPYRSPEAQELRDKLSRASVTLIEQPPDVPDLAAIRQFMARFFRQQDDELTRLRGE